MTDAFPCIGGRTQARPEQARMINIALATYNGARFLAEFLESLTRQTCINFDVVVSDDASTDETLAIVESYSDRLHIRVLSGPVRLGVVKNFERALGACNADYVALADQDDIWHPDKLEQLVNLIQLQEKTLGSATPVLAFSDLALVGEDLTLIASSFYYQTLRCSAASKPRDFALCNHIPGCATMLNRPLLELALPFPTVGIHDWWINLIAVSAGTIVYVPDALIDYRQHQENAVGIGSAGSRPAAKLWNGLRSPFKFLRLRIEETKVRSGEAVGQFAALEERLRNVRIQEESRRQIALVCGGNRLKLLRELSGARVGLRPLDAFITVLFMVSRK